jgi:CHAD domain-containing protein
MRTQAEIERKYEAEPGTGIPTLDEIPGVTATAGPQHETLEAVYYDTSDLRLVRSGLTLRRREGGADEGWHLKVPTGKDQRDEIRLPLSGRLDQLAELTLGYTRGAQLEPVATIRTDRTRWELVGRKGKLLAEVTDDKVTAERPGSSTPDSWREVEVELGEGDVDLLDLAEQNLREAGFWRSEASSKLARVLGTGPHSAETPSRKASGGEAVMAYVRSQVEAIKHYDVLVRQDEDDAVHQMRVATRRLRSALRVYRKLLDTGELAAELQWLGQQLSAARDLEVQQARIQNAIEQLPPELVVGQVQARLPRHFGPEQEKARRNVLEALRGERYLALLDQLEQLMAAPRLTSGASRKARKALPKQLDRAYRKADRRLRAGDIHPARKAAKRLRYGLEAAVPVLGKPADQTRKRAKDFTKLAGEYQDSVVARPLLRTLGMRGQGFTFGLLHGREATIARRVQDRLPRSWKKVKWG